MMIDDLPMERDIIRLVVAASIACACINRPLPDLHYQLDENSVITDSVKLADALIAEIERTSATRVDDSADVEGAAV